MNNQKNNNEKELENMLFEIKQILKKYEADGKSMDTQVVIKKGKGDKNNTLIVRFSDISEMEFFFKE